MKSVLKIQLPQFSPEQILEIKQSLDHLTQGVKSTSHSHTPEQEQAIQEERLAIKRFLESNQEFDTHIVCSKELADLIAPGNISTAQSSEDGLVTVHLEDLPGETPGCKVWREMCVEKNSFGACILWDKLCVH